MAFFSISEPFFPHLDEEPLVPPVVVRIAASDFPLPGIGEAYAPQLGFHVVDVRKRPFLGVGTVLEGGILRRKPQCIPANRMKDVEPSHSFESSNDVNDRVIAHVPHMNSSRRIGQHGQAIELRAARIFRDLEDTGVGPAFLPLRLDCLKLVRSTHWNLGTSEKRLILAQEACGPVGLNA